MLRYARLTITLSGVMILGDVSTCYTVGLQSYVIGSTVSQGMRSMVYAELRSQLVTRIQAFEWSKRVWQSPITKK